MKAACPKDHFTVGIIDDMYDSNLPAVDEIAIDHAGTTACKFWGLAPTAPWVPTRAP